MFFSDFNTRVIKEAVNRLAVYVALCAGRAQGRGCGEKKEDVGRGGTLEGVYGGRRGVWGGCGKGRESAGRGGRVREGREERRKSVGREGRLHEGMGGCK